MIKPSLIAAATNVALLLAAQPTQAGTSSRAWVSGHGTDAAGCGAPTSPCRSFQYVVSNVIAAGGEIDVLDPAGYGAVQIPFALSIVNDGVGTAGVQQGAANQSAITIGAGPHDAVTLRGLNIDGLGTGQNGIVFNAGASLTVVNCVIRHFAGVGPTTGNGILIHPALGSMRFLISNVIAADNGYIGVSIEPPSGTPNLTGVIDHVIAINDQYGIAVNSENMTGGVVTVAIANGVASNNSVDGIYIQGTEEPSPLTVSVDNMAASGNAHDGVSAYFATTVLLGRSVITSNHNGVFNGTSPNTLYTYGNNSIDGNGTDIPIALNPRSTQ